MSFLNNLGQKISDVSQTTIKKTKDLADTAKLNLNISEEERKIDTAYEQIGKWYVEKHREDAEEDVKTWLDAIAVSEARIKECRESIHQMKGVAICPSCGASVDADAVSGLYDKYLMAPVDQGWMPMLHSAVPVDRKCRKSQSRNRLRKRTSR